MFLLPPYRGGGTILDMKNRKRIHAFEAVQLTFPSRPSAAGSRDRDPPTGEPAILTDRNDSIKIGLQSRAIAYGGQELLLGRFDPRVTLCYNRSGTTDCSGDFECQRFETDRRLV